MEAEQTEPIEEEPFDSSVSQTMRTVYGNFSYAGIIALIERSASAPGIPAIAEVLPGYEASSFVGLLMPAGVPAEIPRRFAAETNRSLQEADIRKRLQELGALPVGSTPEEFSAFLRKDIERWRQVVAKAGIVID